jgi:hypothetical protein
VRGYSRNAKILLALFTIGVGLFAWHAATEELPYDEHTFSPIAERFGKDIQRERYDDACSLLTPDSKAEFRAAGGCGRTLPVRITPKHAEVLAHGKFNCVVVDDSTHARVFNASYRCTVGDAATARFEKIDGRWLIVLHP